MHYVPIFHILKVLIKIIECYTLCHLEIDVRWEIVSDTSRS